MSHLVTEPRIGALLGGRYRLEARIASGGMATVYRASDETLGRPVAVKVMHPSLAQDPGFVERFRREAQNAARLNHPNVVTVHDGGEHEGAAYIVMELVDGRTLRDLIEGFGRLDRDTTRHVVSGVASALDHAHTKGVVHRDVKPENVLLTTDGRVKVVDFGIARALADGPHLTGETAIGTVSYIAPEQLDRGEADGRADVYALGIITYEMLTGRPAFDGDTPAAVAAARFAGPVPSPGASPEIDAAVAQATALKPEERFDTPGEFARALGEGAAPTHLRETQDIPPFHNTPPLPTTVISRERGGGRRPKRGRRRRWPWLVLLVAVLLAAGGAASYELLPRTVLVPDLTGMQGAEVRAALEEASLLPGSSEEVFDEAPPGTVVRTDPPAGEEVDEGTQIAIFISKGPELFAVVEVVGQPLDDARAAVEEAGFTVGEIEEAHHDTVPAGVVAAQAPGQGDVRPGTPIDLVVSKGPELRTVPDVAGMSPQQARAAIEEAELRYAQVTDYSDTVPEGEVIRSNPSSGQRVAKGSEVTVAVSAGPRPFPMPSFIGMTLEEARAQAEELGLRIANEYAVPGSGRPSGEVQGQNPPEGTEVRRGTSIDLYHSA